MRRDLISPQTVWSLDEVALFSTRTTFYAQKYHKKTLLPARARSLLMPLSWTHMCGTTIFHFYACFTHEHPRRFLLCCFFTRYLSVSEGKHKMLFVPCLFVVLRGSEGPASIQHPALLLVHNAAFYNRGKGQAFKDQTHLLIYSVYGISGLW